MKIKRETVPGLRKAMLEELHRRKLVPERSDQYTIFHVNNFVYMGINDPQIEEVYKELYPAMRKKHNQIEQHKKALRELMNE